MLRKPARSRLAASALTLALAVPASVGLTAVSAPAAHADDLIEVTAYVEDVLNDLDVNVLTGGPLSHGSAAAAPASFSACSLTVTDIDTDGAVGVATKSIPCANGTYAVTDYTADGVTFNKGDKIDVTWDVTGIETGSGFNIVLDTGNADVVAQ